jgi:hypothetical protein
MIKKMKNKLNNFKGHLKEEASLSKMFYAEQDKQEEFQQDDEDIEMMECFDLCEQNEEMLTG